MANPNHVEILKQGTETWNTWRQNFPEIKPDLSRANLIELKLCPLIVCDTFGALHEITADFTKANLCSAILDRSQLAKANFQGADLKKASFKYAQLSEASFAEAELSNACFNNASLHKSSFRKAKLNEACFIESIISSTNFGGADLRNAILVRADLMDADLTQANLRKAVLSGAYLVRSIFKQADLSQAFLIKAIATETIFTEARLTGACLEDWNINNKTVLDNVDCDFFYRDFDCEHQVYKKRFPINPNSSLGKGEFAAYFQTINETIDLIFNDGISWRAFYDSFLILKERHGEENFAVQAIEKKSNQVLIVRLEVAPELDKAAVESQIRELYEMKLQCLEKLHIAELNAKDGEVKSYMREHDRMERIIESLSAKEDSKVSLHPDQVKILQVINNRIIDEDQISEVLGLSIDIVEYYLENLIEEGYIDSSTFDGMSLTNKGKVAIKNPDRLIPLNRAAINQTTIHSNNIGVFQSANGTASNFTQYIGQNLEEINNLIGSLRKMAQQLPEDERESVLVHLDDLEGDISQPGKQKPQRLKARIAALLSIALSIGGGIAQTTDFTNNLFELANKLGVAVEVDH